MVTPGRDVDSNASCRLAKIFGNEAKIRMPQKRHFLYNVSNALQKKYNAKAMVGPDTSFQNKSAVFIYFSILISKT